MRTDLDYIYINGEQIYRPPAFYPQREDILKGDYVSCTGKRLGDRIGWRYSSMTLKWDMLPQQMVDVLIDMRGEDTIQFDDLSGEIVEEKIRRTSIVALRHRHTLRGETIWKDVEVEIEFIGSHTED